MVHGWDLKTPSLPPPSPSLSPSFSPYLLSINSQEAERRRKLLEEAEEMERVKRVEEAQQAHKESERHAGLRKEGKPFLYVAGFQKPVSVGTGSRSKGS
jgi:hypothetical protein